MPAPRILDIGDDGFCRKCRQKVRRAGKRADGTTNWRGHLCLSAAENGAETADKAPAAADITVSPADIVDPSDEDEKPLILSKPEVAALLCSVVSDDGYHPDVRIRASRTLLDYNLIEDGPGGVGLPTVIVRYMDDPDNPDAYVDVVEQLGTGVRAPQITYVVPDGDPFRERETQNEEDRLKGQGEEPSSL